MIPCLFLLLQCSALLGALALPAGHCSVPDERGRAGRRGLGWCAASTGRREWRSCWVQPHGKQACGAGSLHLALAPGRHAQEMPQGTTVFERGG